MASTVCQTPATDYFSGSTRPQLNTITTYDWENTSDPTLLSDSCDSLSSPTSPDSLVFPQNCYTLPKDECHPIIKTEGRSPFGDFEDWMRWDDPSDAALSPSSTDNTYFPDFKLEPTSPMSVNNLELQGGISQLQQQTSDDAAIFGEVNEEPLFQTPNTLITPPLDLSLSRETLYSSPLSWTRPQARPYTTLSPQEESKLRSIAMPSSALSQSQPQPQPSSRQRQEYALSPTSSRSPSPSPQRTQNKRKSSLSDDDADSPPQSSRPVKKTAHNMIEKRYRTNLNDKIAALRDSVPSLRVMSKKNSRGGGERGGDVEDLQGLTPAHKLNKATVLSKATEYIAHLEKRNKYLVKENAALKSRIDAFEILVMARQPQQQQQQVKREQRRMSGMGGNGGMSVGQMGVGYAGMM